MVRLMRLSNGQFIVTVPSHVVKSLDASKNDVLEWFIDIKRGKVWLEKKGKEV